jgi:glycosyltransferase involved in cell wall biosynthesis
MTALRKFAFSWLRALAYLLLVPILALHHLRCRRRRKRMLVWGPVPIINNKYWSAAMREAGWDSRTLMSTYYAAINQRRDFDFYFDDLGTHIRPRRLAVAFAPLLAHLYVAQHAGVVHIPLSGGALGSTPIWRFEAPLLRLAGVRTVALPYGADGYIYSMIRELTVRHALILSYPQAGRNENAIAERVRYWVQHADAIVVGFVSEGIGRWDVAPGNKVCIDVNEWQSKTEYSEADGKNGPVRVVHAPNHRGAKGTEFLRHAVKRLQSQGLKIDLVMAERMQNWEVRDLMQQVDILADQFVLPGYGMTAIEGMASGLPVLSNLELDAYTRIFRRYSFLDECPILAASPETVEYKLRVLVRNPPLRRELGQAGRAYVEKYHSYATAQYLFGAIYRKLLDGEDVDLMNLFHPLKSSYNLSRPRVAHPLVENRLPPDYPLQC